MRFTNSWEGALSRDLKEGLGLATEMGEMPPIWQEVCAQELGGWALWVLVKVRASPIPAGRSTGHLSRQEAGRGWPSHGPGALKEEVTKLFQGRDFTGNIRRKLPVR